MRAGTQTLIQALQALPLIDDPELDDEPMSHDLSPAESDSDDEGKHGGLRFYHGIHEEAQCLLVTTLASSIHTIHRPVARFRRQESSPAVPAIDNTPGDHADLSSGSEQLQRATNSDEDTDADDFELPKSSRRVSKKDRPIGLSPVLEHVSPKFVFQHHAERSGSTSTVKTVKLNRRARLAEKLADVFEINGINEVVAGCLCICLLYGSPDRVSPEMPCWLMRSVCECACDKIAECSTRYVIVLQGYMYLTNSYLCFFAHMPSREVGSFHLAHHSS